MQGKLMQSGSMTILTTINIVLGASGESDHWGGSSPSISGLYATLALCGCFPCLQTLCCVCWYTCRLLDQNTPKACVLQQFFYDVAIASQQIIGDRTTDLCFTANASCMMNSLTRPRWLQATSQLMCISNFACCTFFLLKLILLNSC